MDIYHVQYLRLIHQLESWLARHWPEITGLVELTSATLLATLARIGGPRDLASNPDATRKLMLGMSHRLMMPEKIEQVLVCAAHTAGLQLLPVERSALMALAKEAHRSLRAYKSAKLRVHEQAVGGPAEPLAPAIGTTTAAVLVTEVGDPRRFPCARAYLKACGLNLKEKSSGKYQGRLRITKHGSGRARQYLWLAVHRWRRSDPIVHAWYEAKVKRDHGSKARAVVALIRKLVKALFHVARGQLFDSHKLLCTGKSSPSVTRHPEGMRGTQMLNEADSAPTTNTTDAQHKWLGLPPLHPSGRSRHRPRAPKPQPCTPISCDLPSCCRIGAPIEA